MGASMILPDKLLTRFYEREYDAELIRKQKLEEEKIELEKQITDKNANVQILSDKHSTDVYPCEECDNVFLSAESRKNHMKKMHKEKWQALENAVFSGPLSQKLNKEKKMDQNKNNNNTTSTNNSGEKQTNRRRLIVNDKPRDNHHRRNTRNKKELPKMRVHQQKASVQK